MCCVKAELVRQNGFLAYVHSSNTPRVLACGGESRARILFAATFYDTYVGFMNCRHSQRVANISGKFSSPGAGFSFQETESQKI